MADVSNLTADATRDITAATTRQAALDKQQLALPDAREKEMAPLEQKEQQAFQEAEAVKPPPPADVPKPPESKVDPKQFEGLSLGLIAMALIGGAVSRGNWLGVSSSLNGAMKGYIDGNKANAQRDYEEYKTKFDAAIKKHDEQRQDYEDTLNNKKLSINAIIAEIKVKAAKWDDQVMRQEAEQKSIDGIWHRVEGLDEQKDRIMEQDAMFKERNAGALAKPTDEGAVGMALTGMPFNQIAPGYGKQAVAQRTALRDATIKKIQEENPGMSPSAAGQELARRTVEFQAGKTSTVQMTKMLGATRQAVDQLDFNIDKATEEMKKLPSSDISPVLNSLARGEEKWTGDPAYAGLFFYLTASATESARLLSGGQASAAQLHQGAAEEAKNWSNIGMTPATWKEVSSAMKAEGRERLKTYEDAIKAGQKTHEDGDTPAASSEIPHGWTVEEH